MRCGVSQGRVASMKRCVGNTRRAWSASSGLLFFFAAAALLRAQPAPQAVAAFDGYVHGLETRLDREHASAAEYVALPAVSEDKVRRGGFAVEELTPEGGLNASGALIHDWRGTAFIPGATAQNFARMLADFGDYPRVFAPQVVRARVVSQNSQNARVMLRMVQKHVLTVVLDTTYAVTFGHPNAGRGWSTSRSTEIREIEGVGTSHERALGPGKGHGFLWRMNTYWSCAERDGGLVVQVESVSMTRGIPTGLGWVVRPFVESVPRDSLEFTLKKVVGQMARMRGNEDQARNDAMKSGGSHER